MDEDTDSVLFALCLRPLLDLRVMVNMSGSCPSLRMISGRMRRLALINQLHTCRKKKMMLIKARRLLVGNLILISQASCERSDSTKDFASEAVDCLNRLKLTESTQDRKKKRERGREQNRKLMYLLFA